MRHYPVNSPRATARILALAANSQGHLTRLQMEAVRDLHVMQQLNLRPDVWHEVLTFLYADLLPLRQRSWSAVFQDDAKQLDKVLNEVDDPRLRVRVFRLSMALAELEESPGAQPNVVRDAIEQRWMSAPESGPPVQPAKP